MAAPQDSLVEAGDVVRRLAMRGSVRFNLRDLLRLMTVVAVLSVIYCQHRIVRKTQARALVVERERNQAVTASDYYKREYGEMFISYLRAAGKSVDEESPYHATNVGP